MTMRVSISQRRGNPYHHPWLDSDAPGHIPSMHLVASCGVEISRLQRPSIRAGSHPRHLILHASGDASRKAQRRRTPSKRRRAWQTRIFRGSPPPAPRPRRDTASVKHLHFFEHRSRGYHSGLEEAPERDE